MSSYNLGKLAGSGSAPSGCHRWASATTRWRAPHGRQAARSIERRVPRMDVLARASKMKELEATPVLVDGKIAEFPDAPGIYAVYDDEGTLQYLGLARKVWQMFCAG